jgi:hypothetical protein
MIFSVHFRGSEQHGEAFHPHEFFFTPQPLSNLYIPLAHSRNYGLPALPRAFFGLSFC